MSYLESSSNIKVFPAANRGTNYTDSRRTSEYNLTSIVNRLVDTTGFVFNYEIQGDTVKTISFNISGYYFHVEDCTELLSTFNAAEEIHANINVNENVLMGYASQESTFSDSTLDTEDSKFKGVVFSNAALANSSGSLKILEKGSDGNWKVPHESKIKFKAPSVCIDDGDLDK